MTSGEYAFHILFVRQNAVCLPLLLLLVHDSGAEMSGHLTVIYDRIQLLPQGLRALDFLPPSDHGTGKNAVVSSPGSLIGGLPGLSEGVDD